MRFFLPFISYLCCGLSGQLLCARYVVLREFVMKRDEIFFHLKCGLKCCSDSVNTLTVLNRALTRTHRLFLSLFQSVVSDFLSIAISVQDSCALSCFRQVFSQCLGCLWGHFMSAVHCVVFSPISSHCTVIFSLIVPYLHFFPHSLSPSTFCRLLICWVKRCSLFVLFRGWFVFCSHFSFWQRVLPFIG